MSRPRLRRRLSHSVTMRRPLTKAGVTSTSTSQALNRVKAASQPNSIWLRSSPVASMRKPSARIALVSVIGRSTPDSAATAAFDSEALRFAALLKRAR